MPGNLDRFRTFKGGVNQSCWNVFVYRDPLSLEVWRFTPDRFLAETESPITALGGTQSRQPPGDRWDEQALPAG